MKKISIVSGSRAEIDLIIQLLLKFEKSKKFQLQIILTGAHLAKDYGNTFTNIKKYNFSNVTKVDIEINKSSTKQILKSISLGVSKFSSTLHRYNPDLIIIPGDRYEMIAVGICAHFMNIRIAHIFGGDVTNGSLDDSIRHCLTKLSDYHFVTSKESKLGCYIALCVLTKVYKHQSYISDICIVKLENLDIVKQNLKGSYRNDF